MDSQLLHVMTISNSIIGVSLLAMPYCFKQCGIILSILILIISSILSRLSCHLLLKSAIIARRRTFEVLAFHTFGALGKFMTEVGIIGFLIGTCIAFFVIMGDLGPTIVAKMTGTTSSDTMRTSILMALALFCVLPLGLLRNVDSLSSVCTATVGFYFCLVVKIISEAVPHLFSGDWIGKVELWRPSGVLQCLPIFSMALSCQTQIFEIYQVVQNASLEKMNHLIRVAINICSCVYIFVGVFGYIAFCNQTFTGNILMSFSSTFLSDAIKIGFVLSVAFSFPLVIFPCRASLNSLLYKQAYCLHEGTDKYIPESRFKAITFVIILIPLVIGIMIPNIELVLGLMGSTIGIMICVIFPATCFICISTKNTNERFLAQIMLFCGILIMVFGTYANLYTVEERLSVTSVPESIKVEQHILKVIDIPPSTKLPEIPKNLEEPKLSEMIGKVPDSLKKSKEESNIVRHEPLEPQEPLDSDIVKKPIENHEELKIKEVELDTPNKKVEFSDTKNVKPLEGEESKQKILQPQEVLESQIGIGKTKYSKEDEKPQGKPLKSEEFSPAKDDDQKLPDVPPPLKILETRHEPPQPVEPLESKIVENIPPPLQNNKQSQLEQNLPEMKETDQANADTNLVVAEKPKESVAKQEDSDKQTVDVEAIKKEDKELLEQEKAELSAEENKNFELLQTLEKQNKEQQELVEKSKKVLEQIKQRQYILEEKKQKVLEKEKQVLLKEEASLEGNVDKKQTVTNKNESVAQREQQQNDLRLDKESLLPLPIVLSHTFNLKDEKAENLNVAVPQKMEIPQQAEIPQKMEKPQQEERSQKVERPQQAKIPKLMEAPKTAEEQANSVPQFHNKSNLPEGKNEQLSRDKIDLPVLEREIRNANTINFTEAKEVSNKESKSIQAEEPPIKRDIKLPSRSIIDTNNKVNDDSDKINLDVAKPLSRDLKSIS